MCRTGVQIFSFHFKYFIFAAGCVFLLLLARGGQNKGEQLQYEVVLCMCYPPAPSALLLLLGASLHRSRNGSPGRGREHSIGGKNVSKPGCWERQDVSDCGLIAGFLCYSSEAQPTHRKCTLG